mmetsp:Transcript_14828/g.36275  ORF Transcript_14828/g.36275 Transcript_14828/m.36275 type:complete len:211 (-) Transcript_14828:3856-4488(-)
MSQHNHRRHLLRRRQRRVKRAHQQFHRSLRLIHTLQNTLNLFLHQRHITMKLAVSARPLPPLPPLRHVDTNSQNLQMSVVNLRRNLLQLQQLSSIWGLLLETNCSVGRSSSRHRRHRTRSSMLRSPRRPRRMLIVLVKTLQLRSIMTYQNKRRVLAVGKPWMKEDQEEKQEATIPLTLLDRMLTYLLLLATVLHTTKQRRILVTALMAME